MSIDNSKLRIESATNKLGETFKNSIEHDGLTVGDALPIMSIFCCSVIRTITFEMGGNSTEHYVELLSELVANIIELFKFSDLAEKQDSILH